MTKAWIAGLLEGDGGIYVSKKNAVSLEITLHQNECQALMKVKKMLGVGRVSARQGSQSVRYRVHRSAHLKTILPSLHPFLLTQKHFFKFKKPVHVFIFLVNLWNILLKEPNTKICFQMLGLLGFLMQRVNST